MNTTKIEWADVVWNPVTGCTKVSEGCRNCYAEGIAKRFWGERKFSDVQCHPERFNALGRLGKTSKRVFVNSMSDLFHKDVPLDFISEVFAEMAVHPLHTFIVLTKRPQRMAEAVDYFGGDLWRGYKNIWLGVSVENQQAADERIPYLLQTPAPVRFVSCEPLLGPVDLVKGMHGGKVDEPIDPVSRIDWAICGGESGPHARPMHPDWVRSLRDQCQAARVPFFFKQWGEWAPDCLCDTPEPCLTIVRPQPGLMGCMFRCGKKAAGDLLDGREWHEYPGRSTNEQQQPINNH